MSEYSSGQRKKGALKFTVPQGLDVSPSTHEEFTAYINSEIAKWAKVIKAAGIQAN